MNEIIIKLIKGFPEINKDDSLSDLISENLKRSEEHTSELQSHS